MPLVRLLDLDPAQPPAVASQYRLVVQNLRLIKAPRKNVWGPSHKKWSEAAIATDADGRLLFLFSRRPYTMTGFTSSCSPYPWGSSKPCTWKEVPRRASRFTLGEWT